jgi:hypothetical protein
MTGSGPVARAATRSDISGAAEPEGMSLSSLRSFSGAASFATNALDTARSTFKAMADAAVPPAGSDASGPADSSGSSGASRSSGAGGAGGPGGAGGAAGEPRSGAPAATKGPAGEVKREDDRTHAEKRKAGMRKGIALDAYA